MSSNKYEHLVPPPVKDIIEKLQNERLGENERLALIQRLEVTRDFCINALARELRRKK